jgi:hypothetical protein
VTDAEDWIELSDAELRERLVFVLRQNRGLMNLRISAWHADTRPEHLADKIVEHLKLSETRAWRRQRG